MCKSCGAMVEHRASERNASLPWVRSLADPLFFHFFFQSWIYIILNFPALVIPHWKVKKAGISKLFFLFFTLSLYNPGHCELIYSHSNLSRRLAGISVVWQFYCSKSWKMKLGGQIQIGNNVYIKISYWKLLGEFNQLVS